MLAATILTLTSSPSLADDLACDAVEEALEWTADFLLTVRDQKADAYESAAMYVRDAAEFGVERMRQAGWSEASLAAAADMMQRSSAAHDDPGEAEANAAPILAAADILAAEASGRCGEEIVPVFVRPGVGDRRACADVIEVLEALARDSPSRLGRAAALAWGAAEVAQASHWNADSVDALQRLSTEIFGFGAVRGVSPDLTAPEEIVPPLVAEAEAICGEGVPALN
jgi:hypothetical protein